MKAISLKELGQALGILVQSKNEAYGSAFAVVGDFFLLLYPEGIKPAQFTDSLLFARIFDKMMRIATRKDDFGESPWLDIAGYALLGARKDGAKPEVKMPDLGRAERDLAWCIGFSRSYIGDNPRELNGILDEIEARLEWVLGAINGEAADETRARINGRLWRLPKTASTAASNGAAP